MRHHNSVLHGLLKHVPWPAFDRLVAAHGADHRVRRLTTKGQPVALLYGQLAGAASLREIETALLSHGARLYHAGACAGLALDAGRCQRRAPLGGVHRPVRPSGRPSAAWPAPQAGRGRAPDLDPTGVSLSGLSADWARFATRTRGAKAPIVYDPDADCPLYRAVTAARVNDITAAKAMPIEPGATYVFDLGYYDHGRWAGLAAAGCRIVTRLKRNTPLDRTETRPVPAAGGTSVLSDRVGHLPARRAGSRKNPFQAPVREVQVKTETGQILGILSNDLDAPAAEIAALCKRRWAIELFCRWVKQTLKIGHFLGTSANAVRIQIAVALIACLRRRLAQAAGCTVESPLALARLVRANLMHRRPIDRLLQPPPTPARDPRQFSLDLLPA